MIRIIYADGTIKQVDGVPGEPELGQLYEWMDCDMIEVPGNGLMVDGEAVQFIVDEEGKILGKAENKVATAEYDAALRKDPRGLKSGWDTLVGTVVILTGEHLLT
jgi:hypothetical protein